MDKNQARREGRLIRHMRVRRKVAGTAAKPRLTIFRSLSNVYCQLIDDESGATVAAASTLTPEIKQQLGNKRGNVKASEASGRRSQSWRRRRGSRRSASTAPDIGTMDA